MIDTPRPLDSLPEFPVIIRNEIFVLLLGAGHHDDGFRVIVCPDGATGTPKKKKTIESRLESPVAGRTNKREAAGGGCPTSPP